jgi:predicted DsbA family dithiol-disulfide isomerase
LPGKEAQKVLENRTYKESVDSDWSYSLEVDPEYIPTLNIHGKLLVNPQRYELFEQFMADNRVVRLTHP